MIFFFRNTGNAFEVFYFFLPRIFFPMAKKCSQNTAYKKE